MCNLRIGKEINKDIIRFFFFVKKCMKEEKLYIYIIARFFLIIDHNTVDYLSTATQKE